MPKWVKSILITVGALVFAFLLVALGLQSHATAKVIGNGTTCGTCHYMETQVASYSASEHHDVGCLACHSSPDFLQRPFDEVKVSARHISVTLSHSEPLSPSLSAVELKEVEVNCYNCHREVVQNLHADKLTNCTSCHRTTPHDRPGYNATLKK
jgi:hypothetical protein